LKYLYNKSTDTYLVFQVLYTYSSTEPYQADYIKLIKEYPFVNFIKEEGHIDEVLKVIKTGTTMPGAKYFCFMVDDMVFFKDFDIEDSV